MKLLSYFVVTPLCVLLSVSAVAETKLNAQQVRNLFTNKTVNAFHELKKVPVTLFYSDSGKVSGIFSNGKLGSTSWSINDSGKICLKVKAKDLCFDVINDGSSYKKYLVKANGQRVLVFSMETFTKGNVNRYESKVKAKGVNEKSVSSGYYDEDSECQNEGPEKDQINKEMFQLKENLINYFKMIEDV